MAEKTRVARQQVGVHASAGKRLGRQPREIAPVRIVEDVESRRDFDGYFRAGARHSCSHEAMPVDNTGNRIERHAHHGARKSLAGTGCREPARERRTAMPSPADRGDLSREFVTVSIAGTCVTLKFIL
ncbi:hypothetical protein [Burkholderia cepacia]|uniref:hypothetical protein n=1 Tax=Burkholderia cepacia TaxID=292 RepID=UPI00299070B6|nr:hypothetical protein [Burkholderia cepacia]